MIGQWLAKKAGIAAGEWLAEKSAPLIAAAKRKVIAAANAIDNAARAKAREELNQVGETLAEKGADVSEAYYDAKRVVGNLVKNVNDTKKKVKQTVEKIAKKLGYQPTKRPVQTCPLKSRRRKKKKETAKSKMPRDGSLMIPDKNCPNSAVAMPSSSDPNGVKSLKGAITNAKKKSAAAKSESSPRNCGAGNCSSESAKTTYYINGINTNPNTHCSTLKKLQSMTCNNVVGIMNDTEGMVTDLMRAAETKSLIRNNLTNKNPTAYAGHTPSVQSLANVLTLELSSGRSVNVVAHSEGGAITSLALIHARGNLGDIGRQANMANANVTTMGSAAQAWVDGPKYTHYIHINDPVPNAVGLGDAAKKPGSGAQIERFGGKEGNFLDDGTGNKRPYIPTSIDDHLADTSYLPYIKSKKGACMAAKN